MEITLYGVNPQRFQISGETAPGSTRVETEKSQTPPGTPAAQGQGCNPPFCQNYYSRSTARLAVSCSRGRRSRRAAVAARGTQDQTRPRPWTVASPEGSSPLLCLAQALSSGRLGQKDKCGPGVKSWGDGGPSRSTRPRGKAGKERSTNTASRGGGSSAGDLLGTVLAAYYRVGSRLQAWETYGSWLQEIMAPGDIPPDPGEEA